MTIVNKNYLLWINYDNKINCFVLYNNNYFLILLMISKQNRLQNYKTSNIYNF